MYPRDSKKGHKEGRGGSGGQGKGLGGKKRIWKKKKRRRKREIKKTLPESYPGGQGRKKEETRGKGPRDMNE